MPGIDIETFDVKMKRDGWMLFPSVVKSELVESLTLDLAKAYTICREMQIKNGIAANTDGTAHHLVGLGNSFIRFLESKPLWDHVRSYFEGNNFILNSFGGMLNMPDSSTYARNVHRDIRTFSGALPLMLNMLVMLDDFTEANGATYLARGSHLAADKPSDEIFFAHPDRAVGSAGSIMLFNSNLWHAGGLNKTQKPRRGLTLTFTRPFMKQQCDYPRVLGYDYADKLSEDMKQVLGYNARVPASLEEWYQPPEKRMYKPKQG